MLIPRYRYQLTHLCFTVAATQDDIIGSTTVVSINGTDAIPTPYTCVPTIYTTTWTGGPPAVTKNLDPRAVTKDLDSPGGEGDGVTTTLGGPVDGAPGPTSTVASTYLGCDTPGGVYTFSLEGTSTTRIADHPDPTPVTDNTKIKNTLKSGATKSSFGVAGGLAVVLAAVAL